MRWNVLALLTALLMVARLVWPVGHVGVHSVPLQAAVPSYSQWKNGPPTDGAYFPIAVWLQSPRNAARYKAAGINLFVGLWDGPTGEQLAALKAVGMPVMCEQNAVGLAHKSDATIIGWMHGDEPDNAQPITDPVTKKQGYGPCVPPARVVDAYARMRQADTTRPIMLNLGQGVANDDWNGRGSGAKLEDYATYVHGGDIVSFDVYPVAGINKPDGENYLWYVPKGVDRLVAWTAGKRLVWNCIECTKIGSDHQATPLQVRAEVWMALIHGSRGLIYFVHQFAPTFDEAALLDDPQMLAAVTAINKQVRDLAPVLNSADMPDHAAVRSSSPPVPISLLEKRHGGFTYLFAVGMRNASTTGTFTLRGVAQTATATVIGEGRTIRVSSGSFTDSFTPYAVHLYRIK